MTSELVRSRADFNPALPPGPVLCALLTEDEVSTDGACRGTQHYVLILQMEAQAHWPTKVCSGAHLVAPFTSTLKVTWT